MYNFLVKIFTARLLFPSHYLSNVLGDPAFDGVELPGFKSRVNIFSLVQLLALFLFSTIFPFSSLFLWVGIVGLVFSNDSV